MSAEERAALEAKLAAVEDDAGRGAAPVGEDAASGGDSRHVPRALVEELPRTMRCALYKSYGSVWKVLQSMPEYLSPKLTTNTEVLVRVHAASVNPLDWKMMAGNKSLVNRALPFIPGFDVSGVVVQAGLDCRRIRRGDEVYGLANFRRCGTFAEYVIMQEYEVALKPSNLSHAEAAAMPMVGTAAYKALIVDAELRQGQKLLVLGGSGGVGTFAVQLAKVLGAQVAATCSERNMDLLRSLKADFVVNYSDTRWFDVLKGEQFDVILDTVGGVEAWQNCHLVLKEGAGSFVTTCGDDASKKMTVKGLLGTGAAFASRKLLGAFAGPKYYYVNASPDYEVLDALRVILQAGAVRPIIDRVYSLEQVHAAVAHSASGRARGKIVISVVPDEKRPVELWRGDERPVDYSVPPPAEEPPGPLAVADALAAASQMVNSIVSPIKPPAADAPADAGASEHAM
jgi:alcohol dehydrogenase